MTWAAEIYPEGHPRVAELKSDVRTQLFDTLADQLKDLMRTRHPARVLTAPELDELVAASTIQAVWVWYPWSNRLVHLLPQPEFVELRTNRNRNKITAEEQALLAQRKVGVVGLSVGQSVSLTMAMERSCGELRLADFDTLDLSNLNRPRCGVHSLSLPKVWVTAREIAEIDPYLQVRIFDKGVTADTMETFLLQDGKLDLVVDECDSLDVKVTLRNACKQHRIPVVMDTSDRGMLDIERFDLEPDRPIFHGMLDGMPAVDFERMTPAEKVPYVLRILGDNLSPRLMESLKEVDHTLKTWPQLATAVVHGGAAAADVARRIGLGQHQASGRFYIDLEALTA